MKHLILLLTAIVLSVTLFAGGNGPLLIVDNSATASEDQQNSEISDINETPTYSFTDAGDHLFGGSFEIGYDGGKNKFEDGNEDKEKEIHISIGASYENMITDKLGIGAFISYNTEITKFPGDIKNTQTETSLTLGPILTAYQPFGQHNRGGLFESVSINGGIIRDKWTYDDETTKNPLGGVIGVDVRIGGFVQPTPNLVFMGSVGMFHYGAEFMSFDEDKGSSPDMVTQHVDFGLQYMNIQIGVNYVLDADDRRKDRDDDTPFYMPLILGF